MKKYTIFLFSLLLSLYYFPLFGENITLLCETTECESTEEIYLYQFEGFGFTKVETATKDKEGVYKFKLPQGNPRFYYLGKDPSKMKPIILGQEENVIVRGTCNNLDQVQVEGSLLNTKYERLKMELGRLKSKTGSLIQAYQISANDPEKLKEVIAGLDVVDKERIKLLESFGNKYPLLTEIAAINTYLSFEHNKGDYYDEVDYFANEFFRFVDFKNELYYNNPWVYESFKEYAQTLSSVNIDEALHQSYLDDMLNKIPENSATYQMALSGIVVALAASKHSNYNLYGKRLIKKYEKLYPEQIASMKQQINLAGSLLPGAEAPDFSQLTPAGELLSLSDLRGKVVLVDFWASWCGPCRRENPNVKRIYEKYKDKGFEVLGVSLDRTKNAWERAIEADGLPWKHISDLKGWNNAAAKLYSVTSIPHTMLLDQEGRIIASKMRGPQLEMELAKIFGE